MESLQANAIASLGQFRHLRYFSHHPLFSPSTDYGLVPLTIRKRLVIHSYLLYVRESGLRQLPQLDQFLAQLHISSATGESR